MTSRSSISDIFIFLLLVTACVVGLMAIWKIRFQEAAPAPKVITQVEERKSLPTPPPAPIIPPATTSGTQVVEPRPTPPGMLCDEENVICINKSYENMLLTNPFSVTGTVRELSGKIISSRLETADGKELSQSPFFQVTTTSQGLVFSLRTFITSLPRTATGTLVITNGSTIPLRIPVRLPRESMKVVIYTVGLAEEQRQDESCLDEPLKVISKEERTIPKTNLPVEATLRTAIDGGNSSALASFSVTNKIASVIFEKDFHGERDACAWRLETASWERTLQQFSSVNQVVFSRQP